MGDVNIRPDQAAGGGGLIDDFDGMISDMRFIMTDYDGKMPNQVPVCQVTFDIDGEESVSLYSVGGDGDFAPDDTGHGLNKLKSKAVLTKTCKFIMLLNSLVEGGFPLNRLDPQDISPVIGTAGHFLRKAVEFKGLKRGRDDRESTVLLCTKIIRLPGEAEAEAGKGKGKGKGGQIADSGMADALAGVIQGIIIEADGKIAKKDVLSALFKVDLPGDKKSTLKLASSDEYLKGRKEWTYEDGILKMV